MPWPPLHLKLVLGTTLVLAACVGFDVVVAFSLHPRIIETWLCAATHARLVCLGVLRQSTSLQCLQASCRVASHAEKHGSRLYGMHPAQR